MNLAESSSVPNVSRWKISLKEYNSRGFFDRNKLDN